MKVTVLIDNKPDPRSELQTEHGLSIYFEAGGKKFLLDAGASGKFAENAVKLGINIPEVESLILSHAHSDHTGGLAEFLRINKKARIFLSSQIAGVSYFSTRRGSRRDISPDSLLFEKYPERFVRTDGNMPIFPGIRLICRIPPVSDLPKANRTLFVSNALDDFGHEMAVRVDTPAGNVILSSCSHNGILNTLAACGDRQTTAYIGGMHLIDSDMENQYETDEQLAGIADKVKLLYPRMQLITGHCTGANAQRIFSEMLGDRFILFHSGFQADI